MNFFKKLSLLFFLFFLFPSKVFAVEPGTVVYSMNTSDKQITRLSKYTTGNTIDLTDPSIPTGTPENIFKSYRYDKNINLSIPVEPGRYEVRLYFAEINGSNAKIGARVFDISLEGEKVLTNFDVFAIAGKKNKAIKRAFFITSDSNLNIDFTKIKDNPMISGIEILKAGPGNELIKNIKLKNLGGEGEAANTNNIDALIVYDSFADTRAKEQNSTMDIFVDGYIKKVNDIFGQSGIKATVRAVKSEQVNFSGDEFSGIVDFLGSLPLDTLEADRRLAGADVVMFFIADPRIDKDNNGEYTCGIGPGPKKNIINADRKFYLAINLYCSDIGFNLTHEVGHLLGALHEEADLTQELKDNALFSYARAYTGEFFLKGTRYTYATMDYSAGANKKDFVFPMFSQDNIADITLPTGDTVTVSLGNATANNSLAMNTYAPTVAAYRKPLQNPDWNMDVNGDGKISNDDAVAIENYIKNNSGLYGAVDVNGDLVVNVDDVNAVRKLLANPLTPLNKHFDVNEDGVITALDVLNIVNFLNKTGPIKISDMTAEQISVTKKVDANGDGTISAIDVLNIVNYLNAHPV